MASSQGALGLYSEVVVGEWVAHGNLLPLMIDALSRVELETYLTQCTCISSQPQGRGEDDLAPQLS